MKRRFRLTGSKDFQRVRRSGNAVRHPYLVMVCSPNQLQVSRVGVSAGRALGKAVQRNRAKRRLRHAVRSLWAELPPGWDILLIARKPLLEAAFSDIQTALKAAFQRAGLIKEVDEQHR